MDISATTAPRSDQLNFDDVATTPITVTIAEVRAGNAEQPVEIHLVEYPGRPFKPAKTMRRVLVAAWGSDAKTFVGRRMTLYGDPTVKFGGLTLGGVRISHLSHIDKRLTLSLTVTRAKRAPFVVEPLPDAPTAPAAITDEQAQEIAADIDRSADRTELDTIGADLKALNLGQHRASLLKRWKERAATLASAVKTPPAEDVRPSADESTD